MEATTLAYGTYATLPKLTNGNPEFRLPFLLISPEMPLVKNQCMYLIGIRYACTYLQKIRSAQRPCRNGRGRTPKVTSHLSLSLKGKIRLGVKETKLRREKAPSTTYA
jgi:hypothetical protein